MTLNAVVVQSLCHCGQSFLSIVSIRHQLREIVCSSKLYTCF